jgi:hypothetical protein
MTVFLNIVITISFATWLGFITWYSIRAKWWKSSVGRNTFAVSLMLTVLLLRATILRWFPAHVQHDFWGIIIYAFVTALGIQRIRFVEYAQREAARARALGYTRRKTDI